MVIHYTSKKYYSQKREVKNRYITSANKHPVLYNSHLWEQTSLWPKSTLLLTCTVNSRGIPENLTSLQLVKKFPTVYGTRRFITTFTSGRQPSLFSARSIQSNLPEDPF